MAKRRPLNGRRSRRLNLREYPMVHKTQWCVCGRKIHLPATATRGFEWACRKCGMTWTVGPHGKPLHTERSRPPSGSTRRQHRRRKKKKHSWHIIENPFGDPSRLAIFGGLTLVVAIWLVMESSSMGLRIGAVVYLVIAVMMYKNWLKSYFR